MNADMPGLAVNRVSVTYRNGHTALRDATFSVPRGSIAALVGINGSGKSTLFKALMGFVRLSHGEIAILGQPVHRALRQNLVAYVPQSEDVDWAFPVLVEDVVMMGRYGHMGWLRRAKAHDREVVDAALARVGMSDYRHRQIGELSGGQKNGCSLPALSPSRARSFYWMSRLPALTSRPKPRSSPCCANCVTTAVLCWFRPTISVRSASFAITR